MKPFEPDREAETRRLPPLEATPKVGSLTSFALFSDEEAKAWCLEAAGLAQRLGEAYGLAMRVGPGLNPTRARLLSAQRQTVEIMGTVFLKWIHPHPPNAQRIKDEHLWSSIRATARIVLEEA